jgi:hypothetical protein
VTRRTVAVLILVSWVASLAWLGWRTSTNPAVGTGGRPARLAPIATFYGVMAGETQVGTAGITLDTTSLGYRLTEVLSLDLPGPAATRHVLRSEASLSRTLRLVEVAASLSEAGTGLSLEAAAGPDSGFVIRSGSGGSGRATLARLPFVPGLTLSGTVPFQMAASGRLRPRGSLATPTLDLLSISTRTGLATVESDSLLAVADSAVLDSGTGSWRPANPDSVRAWLVARQEVGLPVREWIDQQGRILSRDHAFGLRLEQSPFEVNYTNYQNRLQGRPRVPTEALAGSTRLVDLRHRPDTAAAEVRLLVRRRDGPAWPGSVAALDGGRQRATGDTVVIGRVAGADSSPPTRWRNNGSPGPDSLALRQALREGLEADPAEPDTLRRLVRLVAHAVQYVDGPTAPAGLATVLRRRQASLDGKVRLMVALAREAGYPARAVTGVDVSDPALPVHVWVEVWRAGWQAVDPVAGQVPASAYLLRVMEGTADRPLALVPVLGGLRTELLSPAPERRRQ